MVAWCIEGWMGMSRESIADVKGHKRLGRLASGHVENTGYQLLCDYGVDRI